METTDLVDWNDTGTHWVLESVTAGFSVVDEQAWRAWTFEVVVGKVWPVKFTKLVPRLLGRGAGGADKDTPISI